MNQDKRFPVEVKLTRDFEKSLKRYRKLYRSVVADVGEFIALLKQYETPGDRIQGVDEYVIYKVRIKNSDNNKGKSGGYRICYFMVEPSPDSQTNRVVLLIIYSKSERADIEPSELLAIIDSYVAENGEPPDEMESQ